MLVEPAPGVSTSTLIANLEAVPNVVPLTTAQAVARSPGVASVSQSLNAVIGLLVITALMVIGLFILILTVQKSPSLTLMRAIGARRRTLAFTLMLQTTLVVFAAVIAGGIMMALISPLLNSLGVSFDLTQLAVVGVGALVVGLIGSLGAVLRVLRIDPIDATVGHGALK
jgi:putative ABC transport system permease protein